MARIPVVAHRHLALVWCDSAASLAEVLTLVDLTSVPHQKFGERAIALPATEAAIVHEALRAAGAYPRVVGSVPTTVDTGEDEVTNE